MDNLPLFCTTHLPVRIFWSPAPPLHLLFFSGYTISEANLGTFDGSDRHPNAGNASGIIETARYAQGGILCRISGSSGSYQEMLTTAVKNHGITINADVYPAQIRK